MLFHLKNNRKLSKSIVVTLALTSLLACGVDVNNNNTSVAVPSVQLTQMSANILPRNISRKLLQDASVRSGVKTADLQITQVTPKTFNNLCIFKFGKLCTKEFQPIQGWVVVVKVKEQSWTYHVSQSSQIMIEPNINFYNVSQLPITLANKITADAGKRGGLPSSAVKVISSTQKIFGNSCEFKFGEVCNKVYKPIEGWQVVVKVREESWAYHANKSGSQILLDPKITAVEGAKLPKRIAEKILTDAYQRSRLQSLAIKITRTVQKSFSNSCVFNFGEVCTQQYDPIDGWQVVITVNNQFWTYHVDRTGKRLVLDPKIREQRTGNRE